MRLIRISLVVASVAVAVAACGASPSIVGQAAGPSTTASPKLVHTGVIDAGNPATGVIGRFRIVGGPYPGENRPLDGVIEVHRGSTTGALVERVPTSHGRFDVSLATGRYVFVGRSAGLTSGGQGCTTGRAIHVTKGQAVHVTVQCDVP
jgi:hypothetical protein